MSSMIGSVRSVWVARTPRLLILAALVGLGAGLGAVALIEAIELVGSASQALTEWLTLGRVSVLAAIPVAIFLSWLLTSWLAPEVAGHGVPQIIASIAVRGGKIRSRVIGLKTVATALTIGAGGSAGREGSIAQIGAAIGSWLARITKLGEDDVRVLVAAGAGAGISATFNAPIAGMLFAMEVILRAFSIRHLNTIVIASVTGAVVAHSVIGDELTFSVPPYSLNDPRQLLLYGLLALVIVAFAWVFLVALDRFEGQPIPLPAWARPVIFGVLAATLGFFWNDVLGTGQTFVGSVLRDEAGLAWWSLAILAIVKSVATGATLGGRGSGGIFMPSLFVGATVGSAFAQLIAPAWTISEIAPGAFALVGMAATFAAVARAPLTSILIVFEITGDYGLVLPLMVATAISTILANRVRPESAYTSPLARMGIHPIQGDITDLLDTVYVRDTMGRNVASVEADASLGQVQGTMLHNRVRGVPVVSDDELVGVVTETDIVRAGGPSDQVTAGDAMTPNPVTVTPRTPVSEALERMAALGVGRLPVVDDANPTRLVGVFERDDVVTAYHHALGARARDVGAPDRLLARTTTGTRFFEFQIPEGSMADGRSVSEIPWPEGCLVTSIHRGASLLVPTGQTILRSGDAVTVFGTAEAETRLLERLNRPVEPAPQEEERP